MTLGTTLAHKGLEPSKLNTYLSVNIWTPMLGTHNFYISLCWLITVNLVSTKRKHRVVVGNNYEKDYEINIHTNLSYSIT